MSPRERSRLVLIGGSPRIIQAAASYSDVILVQPPGTPVTNVLPYCTQVFAVDFGTERFAEFADTVLRGLRPAALVSLTEEGLAPAAIAAAILGLPAVPTEVVQRFRDKAKMRRRLDGQGLAHLNPRYRVPASSSDVSAAFLDWGGRVVLKPRTGTASRGVRLIDDVGQVPESIDDLLLEEFVAGAEYSVETFTRSGRHEVRAIVEKSTQGFVEIGHVTPPRRLSAATAELIHSEISSFLTALGLESGPAHTEIKVHGADLRIIESHNRIGGDRISELVALTTGRSLVDDTLRQLLGLPEAPGEPAASASAAIGFVVADPGRIQRLEVPDDLSGRSGVHEVRLTARSGGIVAPLRSSADRLGHVITTGATPEEAFALASSALATIRVVTTQEVAV